MTEFLEIPVEVRHGDRLLCRAVMEWYPQSGGTFDLDGQSYVVLERRHRYHLRHGTYRLANVALLVQPCTKAVERSWINGRWLIGDCSCRFNAQSELIRCAVNPEGPCAGCRWREPLA
jgi:hypothetical protein